MKSLLAWWYRVSLPARGPDRTPAEREHTRYMRLTTAFTLLVLVFTLLFVPSSFINVINPAAPIVSAISLLAVIAAVIFNRLGLNIVAAGMIVTTTTVSVMGTMITNPLDPSLIPIFGALVIPVIMAGALMPPVAALIEGGINCVLIVLAVTLQKHTPAYDAMIKLGLASVAVVLPIVLQIIVAIVIYAIMRNLVATIQRADRAEEIMSLQTEIADFEQSRLHNQQQLEEGIAIIAQVHSELAKGNLNARVPVGSEHVLWQVAVPLNNLLNRMQQWKNAADQMSHTQDIITSVVRELQDGRMLQREVLFHHRTGTPVDPLLAEINYLSRQASQRSQTSVPPHPLT